MDNVASGNKLSFDDLRALLTKERLASQEILSHIEDPNFERPVVYLAEKATYKFHRLRHGELTLLTRLPFFFKLLHTKDGKPDPLPLDSAEESAFRRMKEALLVRTSLEPDRWKSFAVEHPEHIDPAFYFVMSTSNMTLELGKKLNDYFATDEGHGYGQLWFGLMHMTPSQVAALPESDYQAVLAWWNRANERLKR